MEILRSHAAQEEVPRRAVGSRRPTRLWSSRPIAHVARDLGINSETLRRWVRQVEADAGKRKELLTSEEREELGRPRGEVRGLRRANEILKSASAFFRRRARPTRTK